MVDEGHQKFKELENKYGPIMNTICVYRRMVSLTDDRLAFIGKDYIYQAANESYCKAHNKRRDEVVGHSVIEVFGPAVFGDIIKDNLHRCLAGEHVRYQSWFDLPGLGRRYMDVVYYPYTGLDGGVSGVVVSSRDITELKQTEEQRVKHAASMATAEELKRSRQRIVSAQESIRKEIAQQLHGTVQSRLIVLLHRLAKLEQEAPRGKMSNELSEIHTGLSELLEREIHPISHRLYPSILRQGLIPALQSLGDQFEALVTVDMELDDEVVRREGANRRLVSEWVRLAAYRIAEEALNNVVKHAKASKVTLGLKVLPDGRLRLSIGDNGQGFDKDKTSSGLGMSVMKDYADLIGGICIIESAPCKGTEIITIFTLAEPVEGYEAKDLPLE